MRVLNILLLILIVFDVSAQKSILTNQETLVEIEQGIDSAFNFHFDYADQVYENLALKYPGHPLPPLFKSIIIYWKYFPVTTTGPYNNLYTQNINLAIEKAEAMLKVDDKNTEAIFLNLMARLLIMQYYADNHESSKVIPFVRRAYKMAKKGFELNDKITDFYFSTGLYNYYREAYPEKHPVYKPIAYFFPDGDKHLGIKQLEYNSHHGIFLDAESLSFLVYISLHFEADYKKASKYTKELYKEYPDNPLFLSYRIRALLLLKKYNKVNQLIGNFEKETASNDFFQMMKNIYLGIIEEQKNKNYSKAEEYYLKAIKMGKKYKPFSDGRLAFAYFGLSRIWEKRDHKKASAYRNKAMELATYKHITFD